MTDDDHKDPKVKALVERDPSQPLDQFVDAATAAQLERWFGLPSFSQVESGEVEVADEYQEDPQVVAVRERRKRVASEIDPALLEAIEQRYNPREPLIKFEAIIEPMDTSIGLVDTSYVESIGAVSEARQYEQPEDIQEAIHTENTPQALLRDLHRLETDFSQPSMHGFENDDEDQPPPEPLLVDVASKIDEAMGQRFRVEPHVAPDLRELADLYRSEITKSWVETAKSGALYNRRVTE